MSLVSTLSVAVWILVQLGLLRYQIWAVLQTRRAIRAIDGDGESDVHVLARERQRNQILRLSVIVVYLGLGAVSFVPQLPVYGGFLVGALLYGEIVLFRNTRADVLLVRRLARSAVAARAGPAS